jgi:hypothetical protein
MDLGDPLVLISGFLIGGVGFVLLIYGKKQFNLKCLATGLAMCIFPYFVSSLLVMWLAAAACIGGLYVASRLQS